MLKISPEESRIINFEDIQFYDEIPEIDKNLRFIIISVDTAISEETGSDKTAMLVAKVYGHGAEMKVYIEPHPINKVMGLPKAIQEMKDLIASYKNTTMQIVIEGGPQKALIQMLAAEGINVKEFSVQGNDKRTRLNMVSPWVKNSRVRFPRTGCEELIDQLVYFGTTKHDDLADSFSMMIMSLFNQTIEYAPIIGFIEHDRPNRWRQINSLSDLWDFGR
jgi:predicted phage terminase large subunit-like protein